MGPKNLDPDLLSIMVMHILTEIKVNIVLFNIHYDHKSLKHAHVEKKDKFL